MGLRVATFNLKDFFDPRSGGEVGIIEAKLASVATLLRQADADVVALQEVGSKTLVARLFDQELRDMGYGAAHLAPADRRGIGCGLVTRLPVLEAHVHAADRLPFPRFRADDPEPFAGGLPLRRPVPRLRVDAGELGVVDVLSVHFKSRLGAAMTDGQGNPIFDASPATIAEAHVRAAVLRVAEALHVRRIADALLSEGVAGPTDHALCIMGDFNDSIESLSTSIVRGALYGVDPSRRLHSCSERVPEQRRFSILHGGARGLIDHVLVSSRLAERLSGSAILNEELRDHGPYVPDVPISPDSDHAPVLAWFA